MDIIEDVGDEPTEWCSNAVLIPKKDGENIRPSLDMTDASKYIKRTRHTIPTIRGLETRLNGAKYFSHLDMNDWYMQLELAEKSRKLTTFYTYRGLKRFKRLHFGANSAAEIFNEEVCKVLAQQPNAVSICDDIRVFCTRWNGNHHEAAWPKAKRWRPVTYRSRAFTDTKSRYSSPEKEVKAVEWSIFANQIYLYGMGNTFEVDTDHKPPVPLLSCYRTTAPLRIERIHACLPGLNYHLNYVPERKGDPRTMKLTFTASTATGYAKSKACKSQAKRDHGRVRERYHGYSEIISAWSRSCGKKHTHTLNCRT